MRIKSFYADSMDTALQCASKEMGDEALILNTRESPHEFRHFGKFEVVCACAQEKAVSEQIPVPPMTEVAPAIVAAPITRLVAIVGPSGVGKSSACAKIAIQAKLELGLSVAVLTWDTGRIGSTDCLRAYCEIAEIPFQEVDSAKDFESILKHLANTQLCVIDTPALAPKEGVEASPIAQSLAGKKNTDVHLVVSSAYSSAYLKTVVDRYSVFQPGFLLPTHLDDTLLALSAREMDCLKALRIKWCSTGPAIPEDLADATSFLEQAQILEVQTPVSQPLPPARSRTGGEAQASIEKILMRYRKGDFDSGAKTINGFSKSAA